VTTRRALQPTAHEPNPPPSVDPQRAGPALAPPAVPPDRQVGRLGGLQPVQHVEDALALVDLDLIVDERAGPGITPPDLERRLVPHQCPSSDAAGAEGSPASSSSVMYFLSSATSNSASRSGRIPGSGLWVSSTLSPDTVRIRFTLRHSGVIAGKSSRVCPPPD